MSLFDSSKWRAGTSLMALGFLALVVSYTFHALRSWFFWIYFVAFAAGLILNQIAWKEQKKAQKT